MVHFIKKYQWLGFLLMPAALFVFLGQSTTQSPHGRLKWACSACHSADSWKQMKQKMTFDHHYTGFPLAGKHQQVNCRECHQDLRFSNVGISCVDCHNDIHHNELGSKCERCHTPTNWSSQENVFSLHQARGFPLYGMHQLVDCDACHTKDQGQDFAGTPMNCWDCHQADISSTQNPNHALAKFDSDCQTCHLQTAVRWQQTNFQHTSAFALRGAHQSLECNSCHATQFSGLSRECGVCHRTDFTQTQNPPHVSAGFPEKCETCHTENAWQPATFDHVQASGFALTGAHQSLACASCHVNNQFGGLPRDCFGCHASAYNAVSNPNHAANQFSHDCLTCHSNQVWSPALFDHSRTNFPLTGAHQTVLCASCHQAGYAGTPRDCFSCHSAQFNGTTDPNHQANQFSHDCLTCHSNVAWTPAQFNHNNTNFPLTGAHQTVQCISCHTTSYAGTPRDCFSCHATQFNSTTSPNHQANQFSHDCLTCHSNVAWTPAQFNHNNTNFPITGAHQTVQCISCHTTSYAGTPRDCFSCHATQFNVTADPNHQANQFSHDCLTCHNNVAWTPAQFNHNNTNFPLTGAHLTVQCVSCHQTGYTGTPRDCYSCHSAQFNATTDPNHQTSQFSHDCTTCHSNVAWTPAKFDHNQTTFPLTGAHLTAQCIACHQNGYVGTPKDCYACHRTQYAQTTDPNHPAANFPTTCQNCHNTTAWQPSSWNHDAQYFPIYSGAHNDKWTNCTDCHQNPSNFAVFSCTNCHAHDKTSMDRKHSDVRNYVYDSAACYSCHPRGRSR